MHEINRIHKRTFFCNMGLCMLVCLLAVFQQYIAGFDLLSKPLAGFDDPGAILAGGIFQIIFAMIIILLGYLAWANFHTLNILLTAWYFIVAVIGIARGDYLSAVVGAVGIVFYYFSIRAMQHEESLSQMDGYPEFQEKFDIDKSDIVIETLLAHKGERLTKSTLFTTDYSLRRKKKKHSADPEQAEGTHASEALAEELKKHIGEAKQAHSEASHEEKESAPAEPSASAEEMPELTEAPEETTKSAQDSEPAADADAPSAQSEQPEQKQPQKQPSAGSGNGGKKKKKKK